MASTRRLAAILAADVKFAAALGAVSWGRGRAVGITASAQYPDGAFVEAAVAVLRAA
jgi:hypothetical protein